MSDGVGRPDDVRPSCRDAFFRGGAWGWTHSCRFLLTTLVFSIVGCGCVDRQWLFAAFPLPRWCSSRFSSVVCFGVVAACPVVELAGFLHPCVGHELLTNASFENSRTSGTHTPPHSRDNQERKERHHSAPHCDWSGGNAAHRSGRRTCSRCNRSTEPSVTSVLFFISPPVLNGRQWRPPPRQCSSTAPTC